MCIRDRSCKLEQSKGILKGVIVQFGGQTPLKLAPALEAAGIPILGTAPDAIDLAEDRERFQALLKDLDLRQPENAIATSAEEALAAAEVLGFPILIRPSYVLGGRAMELVQEMDALTRYINEAVRVSGTSPVLLDRYLQDAIEVDVDALCDHDGNVYVAGIMEHIEEAGIHSGDSACSLPPYSLSDGVLDEIRRQTEVLARALDVLGLMNVQYAVKDDEVYLIEVNPRASRTVPFVAKATGIAIAKVAARLMAGELIGDFDLPASNLPAKHIAVKESVFPFARFPGVDTILGPEMKSTGEVMGLDRDFGHAFAKSQVGSGTIVPVDGTVFISVRERDKDSMVPLSRQLVKMGFDIVATSGTARHLAANDIPVETVNKVLEGRPHIVDAMQNGDIQLVFNTTEGVTSIADSYSLRRTALNQRIPYYTTVAGARAAVASIDAMRSGALEVAPLQSYF